MKTKPVPSLKRLEEAFPGKGAELRKLLKGETKTRAYKSVQQLVDQCWHPPTYSHRLMTALNEVLEGYGVETLRKGNRAVAEYVNQGDMYAVTLVRKLATGTILITCWGDFAESNRL